MVRFPRSDVSTSQDLSSAALDFTTSIDRNFHLDEIICHFDEAVSETITIKLDSHLGSTFDAVLVEVVLVEETDFVFRPQGRANFLKGDEIRVQCTNVGTSGTAKTIIKTSELGG